MASANTPKVYRLLLLCITVIGIHVVNSKTVLREETGPDFRRLPKTNRDAIMTRNLQILKLRLTKQESADNKGAAYYDAKGCATWFDTETYRCFYGKQCVPEFTICDGNYQCDDKSDEVGCPEIDTTGVTPPYLDQSGCAKWYPVRYPYRCGDGSYCISPASLCNGRVTCPDNSDELPSVCESRAKEAPPVIATTIAPPDYPQAYLDVDGCAKYYPDNPYRCEDGTMCLRESYLCDGLAYCNDLSDERGCEEFGQTDEYGCTIPNQVGNTGHADYHKQVLEAHNYYRCLHGLAMYTWNDELASFAETVAADNAREAALEHSGGVYGENLGYASVPTFNHITGNAIVKLWYGEIELYDYSNPGFQKGTGHFTQMIWAGNTEVGCGTKVEGNRVYLACEYAPGGNIATAEYFRNNVPPPL